jgi:hypothetical protein
MKVANLCIALAASLFCVMAVGAQQPLDTQAGVARVAQPSTAEAQTTGPAPLTYDELVQLYEQGTPPAPLGDKLDRFDHPVRQ